jgi:hypothetical protein
MHSKPTNAEQEADATDEYVGSVSKVGQSEEWLLDSGATCGVTYDNAHMTDMKPSDRKITIGNGDKVATQGQGTVMLTDKLGQTIKLTDVYYAPTFTKHIASMRKLIDDNWAFHVADKTEFVFMDPATKGTVKFGRKDKDMLYYFTGIRNVDHANNPLALSLADNCPSHLGHQHRARSTRASGHEDGHCYGRGTRLDTHGISDNNFFASTSLSVTRSPVATVRSCHVAPWPKQRVLHHP